MKKNILLTFTILVSMFIALSLGYIFGGLIDTNGDDKTIEKSVSDDFDSKYISDYYNSEVTLSSEILVNSNSTDQNSVEKLSVDPNRKVLSFARPLEQSEINEIESVYKVNFTEDTSTAGVYTVYTEADSLIGDLENSDLVIASEVDIPVEILNQTVDWGVDRIGATQSWNDTNGSGVIVAVIDSGVQTDHADLTSNLVPGFDYVNNDADPYDDNGHGTHVSGVISAINNSVGVLGAAYNSKIMPLKVINKDGYGYLSNVAKAIYFAADNGAKVINMSLGTTTDSLTLRNAIQYAHNKGVILVAAAGNGYGDPCLYPAAYDEVICVAATDQDNKLASFSNVGAELSAPGVFIFSTYKNSQYAYLSGTSMASPHVAAVAALLRAYCPACTSTEIRTYMRDNAFDIGSAGFDIIFGYGLVDVSAAIDQIKLDKFPPTVVSTGKLTKQSIKMEFVGVNYNPISRSKRIVLNTDSNIQIKLSLDPILTNTNLINIELFVDGTKVYTTTNQNGTYTLDISSLSNNQYVIKAVANFSDGYRAQDIKVLDLTQIQSNSVMDKSNTENPAVQEILGVATSFDY